MPGWRDEADAEDIDGYARHLVNNDGQRQYDRAYANAKKMKENGQTPELIKKEVIREPAEPVPGHDRFVAMIHLKAYAACRELAEIRRRAVEDALQNRPPCYEG
jgi:hypothetical protein